MRKLEKDTVLNSTTEFLDKELSPILKGTQLTSKVLSKIQDGHKQLNPISLPSYCQFPNPSRSDDFNLKEGLGHVSIQPAIDALNNFKKRCIEEIKTKLQAMGPDGVKDSKLAAGAMETIVQVYQAAKCYIKVVQEVNNLIDTYIQTIDIAVNEVTDSIYKLQQEVGTCKNNIFSFPSTILSLISEETLDLLMKQTGSFELLAVTNDLLNEIGKAQQRTYTLLNSPERILLSLEAEVTKLQCALNSLIYSLNLLNIFGHNRKTAHSMYMSEDDYLSDFIYNQETIEAANFNFSITNTGYLLDYNTFDTYDIIDGLNKMCTAYSAGNVKTNIISLQSEPGYIVIPDDGIILSVGLDSRLPANVSLAIELNINSGSTIIKAEATGASSGDSAITTQNGKFVKKALEQFSYSNVSRVGNAFKVILLNNETDLELGSLYRFIEPVNSDSWVGYNIMYNGVKVLSIPTLYKVTNISSNTTTLLPLSASDLNAADFINTTIYPGATIVDVTQPYTLPSLNTHDVPNFIGQTGGLTIYISDDEFYTLVDTSGQPPSSNEIITGPKIINSIADWDLATCQGLTGFTITGTSPANFSATNGTVTYTIPSIQVSSFDMVRYHPYDEPNNPHGGEKIYCKDWALYYYMVTSAQSKEEIDSIQKIHFSGDFPEPNNPISLFAMKAKWGFIPDKG